jgi:hypothetical protein
MFREMPQLRTRSTATLAAFLLFFAPLTPAAAQGRILRSTATTGAFDLTAGNVAKLYVIDFGSSRTSVATTLELFDIRGRRVASLKTSVRPGVPAQLAVDANAILDGEPSLGVYARATVERAEADNRHAMRFTVSFGQPTTAAGGLDLKAVIFNCPIASGQQGSTGSGVQFSIDCTAIDTLITP